MFGLLEYHFCSLTVVLFSLDDSGWNLKYIPKMWRFVVPCGGRKTSPSTSSLCKLYGSGLFKFHTNLFTDYLAKQFKGNNSLHTRAILTKCKMCKMHQVVIVIHKVSFKEFYTFVN